MATTPSLAGLVERAEDPEAGPGDVRTAMDELIARDGRLGVATALGILSRPPHVKPSTGLLIDPSDRARRLWSQRVAAASALIGSPAVCSCFDELADELRDSPELAADVLAGARPYSGLSGEQTTLLLSFRRTGG